MARKITLKTVTVLPNLKVVNRKLVNRETATKISLRKVANFRDVLCLVGDGTFVVLATVESLNESLGASLLDYRPDFRFPLITLSILASYPCQKMKNRGSIQPRASYTTKHRFLIRCKETYETELNIPHQICLFFMHTPL